MKLMVLRNISEANEFLKNLLLGKADENSIGYTVSSAAMKRFKYTIFTSQITESPKESKMIPR